VRCSRAARDDRALHDQRRRLTLTLLLAGACASELPAQGDRFARLDSIVSAELTRSKAPGIAVALVEGDRIVFARGYGVGDLESRAPVTPDMLFQIGSSTKPLTALLVATLAERGVVSLDAPVRRYVPELDAAVGAVSLHQLLSQTSGLRDEAADSGASDEAALGLYVRSWPARYAILRPGTTFSYSNPNFTLAGAVAAAAGRRPFAALMDSLVFAPLGMSSATFRPDQAARSAQAVGYLVPPDAAPRAMRPSVDDTRHWPSGYARVSVRELARFVLVLTNRGRLDGKQVVPQPVIDRMTTGHARVPAPFDSAHYGYGLFVERYRGELMVWHPGSMPGFSAMLRAVPARRVGVVILANRDALRLEPIADAALSLLIPTLAPSVTRAAKPVLPFTPGELASIAGSYENRWPVELFSRGDSLFIRRFGSETALFKVAPHRYSPNPGRGLPGEEVVAVPASRTGPGYLYFGLWAFGRR
jgi:CubicO group peptidase (beta-lactamase class C family)